MRDVGAPTGIAELGYTEDDVPALAEGAIKQERLLVIAPKEAGLRRSDPDPAGVAVSPTCSRWRRRRRWRRTRAQAVLAAIADGRLEPGGRYSVAQLAEQLGISRTPVREALLVLEREGRVEFERNRGVRILETTAADVAEVFELRLLLEVPATAKACGIVDTEALAGRARRDGRGGPRRRRAGFMDHDERFHELILLAAGNRRLAAIVAGLRDTVRGRGASTVGRSRSLDEIQAEHGAILDALRAGDADRAGAAMRYHLRRTGDLLAAQYGRRYSPRDRRRVGAGEPAVDEERRGGDVGRLVGGEEQRRVGDLDRLGEAPHRQVHEPPRGLRRVAGEQLLAAAAC